jgi:DNA-binding transcriptional MerR regulator
VREQAPGAQGKAMFKIGDFSRLSQVSVNTLRHYDELGLLKPLQVDRFTGYRYYSIDQLPRLQRILALKDLGFSLEQIAQMLDQPLSLDEMQGMFRLKRAEVEQQAQAEQARLARIEARLRFLELEGKMPEHDVVVKKIEPRWVACEREVVATVTEMQPRTYAMFNEIYTWIAAQGLKPNGPPLSIYYNHEYTEQNIDVETAAFIERPPVTLSETERIKLRQLEGIEQMACILHSGRLDNILETYAALGKWIEANGYSIAGPCREIYISPPSSDQPVTEIQYPVDKL